MARQYIHSGSSQMGSIQVLVLTIKITAPRRSLHRLRGIGARPTVPIKIIL